MLSTISHYFHISRKYKGCALLLKTLVTSRFRVCHCGVRAPSNIVYAILETVILANRLAGNSKKITTVSQFNIPASQQQSASQNEY